MVFIKKTLAIVIDQSFVLVAGTWHHCRHRVDPGTAINITIVEENGCGQQQNQLW